jgi:hypothetical protein
VNLGLSVSEHYLNQLIQSTMQAGLWEKDLEKRNFLMGPETAFVIGEEKGDTFALYIDVVHKLKGLDRLLTGLSEIRFPIKFQIGLNIVDINGVPVLKIKVKKVVTDEEMIINGIKKYDLESTVPNVRFRRKIINAILKEVNKLKDSTLVNLQLREFKGTYLEELEFYSDGLGRANATLKLGKKNSVNEE